MYHSFWEREEYVKSFHKDEMEKKWRVKKSEIYVCQVLLFSFWIKWSKSSTSNERTTIYGEQYLDKVPCHSAITNVVLSCSFIRRMVEIYFLPKVGHLLFS